MIWTINNNLLALKAARQMRLELDGLSDSTRRLSSGLRISTAADDPAGLAISELAKAKSRALGQARRNVGDAISMTNTADGQLTLVSSMLTRLEELAQQASTGTYTATQREIIRNEAAMMISDIERMGKSASFNGIKLLASNSTVSIQNGTGVSDQYSLNLFKTTSTTLGGSLLQGQKAYMRLSIDGGAAGTAKLGASLADSIQQAFFGNQTITVLNAGDAKTVSINSAQGNNSAKDILTKLEDLDMDGLRTSGSLTLVNFNDFTKTVLAGSEGDVVQFDVDISRSGQSSISTTVSCLVGQDDAATLANINAALLRVANYVNTSNGDTDIIVEGDTLESLTGQRISIGNLGFVDSAGIVIGGLSGTANPGDDISLSVGGINITTTNTSRTAALDNIYSQLTAGLAAAGQLYDPAQYLSSTSYAQPSAATGSYIVRRDTVNDTVVVARIGAGQDIQTTLSGGDLTQAAVGGFTAVSGRQVYLQVDGTQVSFTAGTGASGLATAINTAGIAGVTAQAIGGQTYISRTSQPAQNFDLSGYFENRTARIGAITGPAGENVSFSLNGQAVAFTTGASLASNAQLLYNAIVGASPANMGVSLNLGAGTVTLSNSVDSAISFSGYSDGGHNNTHMTVSGLFGATGSQTLSATGVTAASIDNPSASSLQVTPSSGSSGGGTLNGGATITVAKNAVQLALSALDAQSNFSSASTLNSVTNTSVTATARNGGARSAGIKGLHGEAARITSGTAEWATVNSVGYMLVDANSSFEVRSDVDGTGLTNGTGAFYSAAGQNAQLEYVTSAIQAGARLSDFVNKAGDTLSLSIEGVNVSFQAKGTALQSSNANALYNALLGSQAQLAAAGVSFTKSANGRWVYLTKDSGTLSITGYGDNDASFNSGLTVQETDSDSPVQLLEGQTTQTVVTPFTPIAQLDLMTQAGAGTALDLLRMAITANAGTSAAMGAAVNVFTGMQAGLDIDRLNTEAMLSRIVDTNIALEMAEHTRRQVLLQVSEAMLAQANILPRQLLRLIQSGMLL